MNSLLKSLLLALASLALVAMPLNAADNPKQPEVKPRIVEGAHTNSNCAIPFRGKLDSKTESSITIGSRTFEITSDTRLMKGGKPAKLADAVVGEEVSGSYQDKDGKLVAKMVQLGPRREVAVEPKEKNRPRPPVEVTD